jgi:YidC/Oxa1 family membrane protein insertase
MGRMKQLQPKIEKLKERYQQDKIRLNQELMELYRREKMNPAAGCLPMLIQAPIFFCLYKVLFVTIEMRHAPFFGWIQDLSAPDPTSFINLFGLLPFDAPSFLHIGIWPLLMGITMLVQQRINPKPADPTQAKVMLILPIVFTYMFGSFPAGLVIYWTWSNILTILQQWSIMRLNQS